MGLAVLLLAPCALGYLVTEAFAPHSTVYVTATEYVPPATATATNTPLPTATPTPKGPHIISGPTIGGTQASFDAAYGQPSYRGPVPWYEYTTQDGLDVVTCFCDSQAGLDGQQRVDGFHITPGNGTTWTEQQTQSLLMHFLPPDAVHVRDFTDPDVGLAQVYQSKSLALTFPASAFTGSNGEPNPPPGTVSADCHNPIGPGCDIVLGT